MHAAPPPRETLARQLEARGIKPTRQRVDVLYQLHAGGSHLGADELHARLTGDDAISRGTVYNSLNLLVAAGVVREVIVDAGRVIYDVNTRPHHHFYDVDTHELTDVPAEEVGFTCLPVPPAGAALCGVDIVFRISRNAGS